MSPNAGGGGGLRGLRGSQGTQIKFGDLTPYLTYANNPSAECRVPVCVSLYLVSNDLINHINLLSASNYYNEKIALRVHCNAREQPLPYD
jgi:hypothetical protein